MKPLKCLRAAARGLLLLLLMLLCDPASAADGPARADTYEKIAGVPIESVVPPAFLRSAMYTLEPTALAADNFYHFKISSDHRNYAVTSRAMLRVRLHEIATVAELMPKLGASNITLDRRPGGRRGVGSEDVVDILTDPIGTAAQLLGNIQYNVNETFSGGSDDDAPERPPTASVDLAPDPHKRSAAAQLGVDVYSSSPQLQALLEAVARARSGGKTLSSFSPLIRNVYAGASFGSGVPNMQLDSRLKNTSSEDLNAELVNTLDALGVAAPIRIAFLTHPAFTPRTRLYFVSYVELLADVDRVAQLVEAATSAQTEADAVAYVNYARMLAYYQINAGRLTAVVTGARFPTLATADRHAVLALPLDYLAWTEAVAAAADTLHDIRQARGLDRFIVLLAGSPTARAREELERRQIEVHPEYSF